MTGHPNETSMTNVVAIPVHRTKVEMVHHFIREQILSGELAPGQRITLAAMAKTLGTSQMPVREALLRLQQEDLVVITPHTGIHIIDLEKGDALELFQVRAALERLAARLACLNDGADCAAKMDTLNDRFKAAFAADDLAEMSAANWEFHRVILHAARNSQLTRQIEDVWDKCFRFRLGYKLIPGRARSTIDEHRAMVEAMRRGDCAAAELAAMHHVEAAGADLIKILENAGD